MKRGGPLKRRTRLKPRSAKVEAARDEHAVVREAVFKRDSYTCRIAPFLPDLPCRGRLTPHHVLKASQGGKYTVENLVSACVFHNDWCEDNPDDAVALGLVKRPRASDGAG